MNNKSKAVSAVKNNLSSVSTYEASPMVRALAKETADYDPRKVVAWAKKRHEARLKAVLS